MDDHTAAELDAEMTRLSDEIHGEDAPGEAPVGVSEEAIAALTQFLGPGANGSGPPVAQ